MRDHRPMRFIVALIVLLSATSLVVALQPDVNKFTQEKTSDSQKDAEKIKAAVKAINKALSDSSIAGVGTKAILKDARKLMEHAQELCKSGQKQECFVAASKSIETLTDSLKYPPYDFDAQATEPPNNSSTNPDIRMDRGGIHARIPLNSEIETSEALKAVVHNELVLKALKGMGDMAVNPLISILRDKRWISGIGPQKTWTTRCNVVVTLGQMGVSQDSLELEGKENCHVNPIKK